MVHGITLIIVIIAYFLFIVFSNSIHSTVIAATAISLYCLYGYVRLLIRFNNLPMHSCYFVLNLATSNCKIAGMIVTSSQFLKIAGSELTENVKSWIHESTIE